MMIHPVITITHENEKNKGDSRWFRVMDINLNGDKTHHPLSGDITWYIAMSNLVKNPMKSCSKDCFSVHLQFFLHLENHMGPEFGIKSAKSPFRISLRKSQADFWTKTLEA